MIRLFLHFYENLIIVLILDTGCEFFCAKCVEFALMINLIKKYKQNFCTFEIKRRKVTFSIKHLVAVAWLNPPWRVPWWKSGLQNHSPQQKV